MDQIYKSKKISVIPRWADIARKRKLSYPLANSSRRKERRWPLVLRFTSGAIHGSIIFPVTAHALFTVLVVCLNHYISSEVSLPTSIIPSLSIVVGLMLVFRNQTAYTRVWNGRLHLNTITTAIRCLSRQILANAPAPDPFSPQAVVQSRPGTPLPAGPPPSQIRRFDNQTFLTPEASTILRSKKELTAADDAEYTITTLKILMATLYTVRNHLRSDWGVSLSSGTHLTSEGQAMSCDEYLDLLPTDFLGHEHQGLSLTLQLLTMVEAYVSHGVHRNWFHNASASTMLSCLHNLTDAYGSMEVIRLTPIPVAHLIHHSQTLALFCLLLPLSIVSEIGWWAVPLVSFVAFTLYGIEGIAKGFEDPFAQVKGDVDLDNVVEDSRREVEVLLAVWKASRRGHEADSDDASNDTGPGRNFMFIPAKDESHKFEDSGEAEDVGVVERPASADNAAANPLPHAARIKITRNAVSEVRFRDTATYTRGIGENAVPAAASDAVLGVNWIGAEDIRTPSEERNNPVQAVDGGGMWTRRGSRKKRQLEQQQRDQRRQTWVGEGDEGVVDQPVVLA